MEKKKESIVLDWIFKNDSYYYSLIFYISFKNKLFHKLNTKIYTLDNIEWCVSGLEWGWGSSQHADVEDLTGNAHLEKHFLIPLSSFRATRAL